MFYIINFLLKIYLEKIIINKHYLLELFQYMLDIPDNFHL